MHCCSVAMQWWSKWLTLLFQSGLRHSSLLCTLPPEKVSSGWVNTVQHLHLIIYTSSFTLQHLHISICTSAFALQCLQFSICTSAFVLQHLCFSVYTSALALPHLHFHISVCTSVFSLQHLHFSVYTSAFTLQCIHFSIYTSVYSPEICAVLPAAWASLSAAEPCLCWRTEQWQSALTYHHPNTFTELATKNWTYGISQAHSYRLELNDMEL